MPGNETFFDEAGNGSPILIDQFQPGQRPHLREINSAETHSRDENIDAIAQRLVIQRIDGLRDGFRAVGLAQPAFTSA